MTGFSSTSNVLFFSKNKSVIQIIMQYFSLGISMSYKSVYQTKLYSLLAEEIHKVGVWRFVACVTSLSCTRDRESNHMDEARPRVLWLLGPMFSLCQMACSDASTMW